MRADISRYLIVLLLFLLSNNELIYAGNTRIIGFLDPFQCSSCNKLSYSLKKYPKLLKEIQFVFSSEIATVEQTEEFLYETLGIRANLLLNDKLFAEMKALYKDSHTPYIALYDTVAEQLIYSIPIDSLELKIELLNKMVEIKPPYRYEIIDNPRITRMIGWKSIACIYPKLFAASYQNTNKIFYVDVETKKYDSLYINDSTLQQLYRTCGISYSVAQMRVYYDTNSMPVPLYQFSPDLDVDGNMLNTYVDLLYYDPGYTGDTIRAKWYSFFASFNTENKQLKLKRITHYEKNVSDDEQQGNTNPIYSPDFVIKRSISDTLLLISCDKNVRDKDSVNKTKLFINYVFNRAENQFIFNSVRDSITLANVKTFRGKNFNDFHTHFFYQYKHPLVYFAESDQVYDVSEKRQVSLTTQLKGIGWIHDITVSKNTITLLCKEKESDLSLFVLDRKTYTLLDKQHLLNTKQGALMNNIPDINNERVDADLHYMSNIVLSGNNIFYVNKSGKIVRLFLE